MSEVTSGILNSNSITGNNVKKMAKFLVGGYQNRARKDNY